MVIFRLARHRVVVSVVCAVVTASASGGMLSDDARNDFVVGQKLFADKRLSADGTVSCETCHQPARAFSDGRAVSVGVGGAAGVRNAPSLTTVTLHKSFFWDGRSATLEAQVLEPLLNPGEHGLHSRGDLVRIVQAASDYPESFRKSATAERIAAALGAYVRAIAAASVTRFDRWRSGDKKALTEAERRGFEVFRSHAGCTTCHLVNGDTAPFTDDEFHSVGLAQRRIGLELAATALRAAKASDAELTHLITSDANVSALGRFNVTKRPADIGKYRTPSLRNVALTGPYMHDGSVPTLEEAVDIEIYYHSVEAGHPIVVTPEERKDLVAFLRSLTAEKFEGNQRAP